MQNMNRNYVYFNQGDPQWAEEKLAGGNSTIKKIGCAMTCVSMIIRKNPSQLNKWLIDNKGYENNLIQWNKLTPLGIKFIDRCEAPQVKSNFDKGYHVILEVQGTTGSHFVLMTGYQGDVISVMDPGHKNTNTYQLNKVKSGRVFK